VDCFRAVGEEKRPGIDRIFIGSDLTKHGPNWIFYMPQLSSRKIGLPGSDGWKRTRPK
jgi:hypothetical protein